MLYKELDQAFPDSKFILTTRDEKAWLKSAKRHFKSSYTDMRKWIYENGVLEGNEDLYLKRYRTHYKEVKMYFEDRTDDLLIMSFENGDGWEKLCTFLNKPIPNKPFPHSNKGSHNYNFKDKMKASIRQVIPAPFRKVRVVLLEKLGLHKGRNRFNNAEANRNERLKRKNQH